MEAAQRHSAPVVFEDGLGERLSAVGGANEPLEVLKVSNELSAVSSFEPALREQVLRLADFRHDAFAHVRSVERLDARSSTVVVVSDRVRGVRLSEILATVERQGIPLELSAALCLVRQLVAAVAALHEAAPDSCHGAIAPERVVVTPDGRLVVAEYVLGPALEELRFSQERYWRELGIALPHTFGLPRFDLFADVTQVGAVSLALVLGRRLALDEYPSKISEVVDQASTSDASGEREPLPVLLRAWLRSALQLEPRHSFVSGIGMKKDLDIALSHANPEAERAALRLFLSRYAAAVLADRVSDASVGAVAAPPAVPEDANGSAAHEAVVAPTEALPAHATAPAAVVPVGSVSAPEPSTSASPATAPSVTAPPVVRPAVAASSATATVASRIPQVSSPSVPQPTTASHDRVDWTAAQAPSAVAPPPPATTDSPRPIWMSPWAAAAAAVVVLATLGFTLWRPTTTAAAPPTTATLTVGTNPSGVSVLIDGVSKGSTPLNVSLASGDHVLELVTQGERRRIPLTLAAGAQVTQYFELAASAASNGTGNLQIRTDPPRALVTVDGQSYGRTPTLVSGLAPGPHAVVLQGDGDRVSEQVVIEAGATASLVVPMQRVAAPSTPVAGSGWIAVTAPAEVQIYENQRLLGTSRLDRIMVPSGRHELELVNESLGFKATRAVDVANGQVAAVRPEWPRGSVALNALPWAEVFVDGDRLGETPIGSAPLPIGVHEVVFRHPELGEKRANVIVTSGAPARLSVDMRAK